MLKRMLDLPPVSFVWEVWDTYNRVGVPRSAAA